MQYEKSCGVIAYKTVQGVHYYLIIRALNGEYGFPKGHVEQGETEYETAIREVKEETGIDVRIMDWFRKEIEYPLLRKPNVMKQAVYFIGQCMSDDVICQEAEVAEVKFVTAEQAMELLSFENTRAIMKEAAAFVLQKA